MSAASQYATGSARDRIERALQATGKSVDSLNENDLAPIEHFHTLELRATESLVELAGSPRGTGSSTPAAASVRGGKVRLSPLTTWARVGVSEPHVRC